MVEWVESWEESWERLRVLRGLVVVVVVGRDVLVLVVDCLGARYSWGWSSGLEDHFVVVVLVELVRVDVEGLFVGAWCSVCSVFRPSGCEIFAHDWSSLSRSFEVSVMFFARLGAR